jgi:hypothetical protein
MTRRREYFEFAPVSRQVNGSMDDLRNVMACPDTQAGCSAGRQNHPCASVVPLLLRLAPQLRGFIWHRRQGKLEPVESRRGAVSRERSVSPPRSSNRTCGFPASGFPTGFMTGSRHGVFSSRMSQSRHTKIAEHRFHAERPDASRGHLMTPDEKVTHAVIQVGLDHAVRDVVGSGTKLIAPSPRQAVQRAAHLDPLRGSSPWPFVPRHQACPCEGGESLPACRILGPGPGTVMIWN